jgi:hypothetical protein
MKYHPAKALERLEVGLVSLRTVIGVDLLCARSKTAEFYGHALEFAVIRRTWHRVCEMESNREPPAKAEMEHLRSP